MKQLELLSGAKTAAIGIEAIKHGADAVYIGAERFGARAAAGNSLEDIKKLIDFAHLFHARVYVTINTILKDNELKEVRELIYKLYDLGADAILVQDMAILQMDIPPIALHASTQCDNCTPEKIKFLEDAGFSQVVLARECGIEQIREIRKRTNVKLEAFIHGALCVSYSGRCYASQFLNGRSANRGECSQICRLPFDLQDSYGHSYGVKHWLSLKDLNLSDRIEELAKNGISSFKIEGRLKDSDYVKNTTGFYNNLLNEIIARNPEYCRSSDGEVRLRFSPDLSRSFNRGFTEYFYNGRISGIDSSSTPKSIGKKIGVVTKVLSDKAFSFNGYDTINKQDGLCYFDNKNQFQGLKVNKVENSVIYSASPVSGISSGSILYRNSDAAFLKLLDRETASRRVGIHIRLNDEYIHASDGKIEINIKTHIGNDKALTDQKDNIIRQLSKLGDSIYEAKSVSAETSKFYPSSYLSTLRRELVKRMDQARLDSHPKEERLPAKQGLTYISKKLDYTANVYNKAAEEFYHNCGVESIQPAFEQNENGNKTLMWCRHCLKFMVGLCPKFPNPDNSNDKSKGVPTFLISNKHILRLRFDCKNCEMLLEKE